MADNVAAVPLSFWAMLAVFSSLAPAAERVRLELEVKVPVSTPAEATVYLAGNLPDVGLWKADGVKLERVGEGRFSIVLDLPKGDTLQFKLNRGNWLTVEKTATGDDVPNRKILLTADQKVEVEVLGWASGEPVRRKSTLTGNIRVIEGFESKILLNKRRLVIYFPPGYDAEADRRYPVLYMHDGQNVFDDATSGFGEWRADETAERLIGEGKIPPIIIVGIDNGGVSRINEYTPSVDERVKFGGKAGDYERFLFEEVKPFIDQTCRTKPDRDNTAVLGSSLGGLVSLHIAMTHSDKVSRVGVVSPSLWWNEKEILKQLVMAPEKLRGVQIWLDMGTAEAAEDNSGRNVGNTRELVQIMEQAGLKAGTDYKYLEVVGGEHNEAAWAARFDQMLLFLFGN